jgi:hypothetical protein
VAALVKVLIYREQPWTNGQVERMNRTIKEAQESSPLELIS